MLSILVIQQKRETHNSLTFLKKKLSFVGQSGPCLISIFKEKINWKHILFSSLILKVKL